MSEECPRCRSAVPTARLGACPRCLLEAELPPPVLDGFLELHEEIGHGGMGSVYRARDLKLGRTVAVKLLPAAASQEEENRTRFDREARALAMLSHPNIVSVHTVGREGDQSYIVMEFVDGQPLPWMMPMGVERAVPIALQVCDALAYAHQRGVVHRDIKPENILVDPAGRVKVTDFGIARFVGADRRGWTATSAAEVLGTPHYMAPEAVEGAPPDPRMDLYSLGVVLHQMVTGRLPIGEFEPPPAPLEPVVRKALASPAARRYQTVEEMRRDLAGLGAATPAADFPPHEELWLKAVALLQAISTGVAILAFVRCVTPRVLSPDEVLPLIVIGKERLPDGSVYTLARFETWHTFAALATFAVAIAAYGFLRWHWRREGLERPEPDRPVAESGLVFKIGLLACLVYALRLALEVRGVGWAANYIPILGAFIEVVALFFLWVSILKAWRVSRPLRREPRMWLGFTLALLPPAANLVIDLLQWRT
jgi:serine/threonine-protein kinase